MHPTTDIPVFSDVYAAARQKIDTEITQLEERIMALKTRRNSFTPFACLHAEIMQEIYILAYHGAARLQVGKTALRISWVCRFWRDLALQTSALWNYFDILHSEWLTTAVSRTQNRPLFFFIPFQGLPRYVDNYPQLVYHCLEHLPRTKKLKLSMLSDPWSPYEARWAQPAPFLVDLHLSSVALPDNIGPFPALRNLTLERCHFSWASLPFQLGLKRLTIKGPLSMTSVVYLANNLRVMGPEIEVLELMSTVQRTLAFPATLDARVELPKIKSFLLHEVQGPVIDFLLNQFSFPPDDINLINIGVFGETGRFEVVQSLIAARGLEKWPGNMLEIQCSGDSDSITIIVAVQHEERVPDIRGGVVIPVQLNTNATSLTFRLEEEDMLDALPVLDTLPLHPIDTVKLSKRFDVDNVLALMEHLDDKGPLVNIAVSTSFISSFTRYVIEHQTEHLQEIYGDRKDDEETGVDVKDQIMLFHHLSTLVYFDDSDVEIEDIDPDNPAMSRLNYQEAEALREWLQWRCLLGLKLKKLVIKNVWMDPEVEQGLGALFDTEVVDEFEYVKSGGDGPLVDSDFEELDE